MGKIQEEGRLDKRRKFGRSADICVKYLTVIRSLDRRPNPLLPEDKDTTPSCHVPALCVFFITHSVFSFQFFTPLGGGS